MFEIRVDGKVRVNVVNTAAAALSNVKLKVGGSPVMNGVVRDLSYDLNKVVPLTTSYLGNYIDIDKLHLTSKSTTFVSFIIYIFILYPILYCGQTLTRPLLLYLTTLPFYARSEQVQFLQGNGDSVK